MGPRKAWAAIFFSTLLAAYGLAGRRVEAALRGVWFRSVTRPLAADARGLAPPSERMWLGASRPELPQSLYGMDTLEAQLGQSLTIASFYVAWGEGDEHAFPSEVIRNLGRAGYLPLITWEPWLNAFPRWSGQVPARALRLIADGAVDGYIRRWAHEAVRSGRPLLLRPGHEATNPAYAWGPSAGNTASDYRRFWQHVRQIFRDEGARNVSFVWTPFSAQDREWFPGLEAVDWIGFDIFNFGGLAQEGIWFDFHSLTKPFYDAYAPLGLPLMITEVGSSSVGGNKADWLREMFHDVAHGSFPALRALVLFDQPSGHTVGGLPVDWSVGEVASALDGVRAEASGPGRFESRAAR